MALRFFISLVFLIISFSSVAFCETLKIGALLDLSKEYVMESTAFRQGIELATAEINQQGGVNGKELKIIFEDTHYDMKNVHILIRKAIY